MMFVGKKMTANFIEKNRIFGKPKNSKDEKLKN